MGIETWSGYVFPQVSHAAGYVMSPFAAWLPEIGAGPMYEGRICPPQDLLRSLPGAVHVTPSLAMTTRVPSTSESGYWTLAVLGHRGAGRARENRPRTAVRISCMSVIDTVITCARRQNFVPLTETGEPELATCACGARMSPMHARCVTCQIREDDAAGTTV